MANFRSNVFWRLDRLKGSPIRKHYDEVKFIIENPGSQKAEDIRGKHLQGLLQHATLNVENYKSYNSKSLNDFPVINKSIVLNNFDAFKSNSFEREKKFSITTGGSTGIPFKLWHDHNKKDRNTADTILFSELANYELGSQLVYLKLWAKKHQKSAFTLFAQNVLPHDVMDVAPDHLDHLIKAIKNSNDTKTIMGYSSFLEQMNSYVENKSIDMTKTHVRSIISIAEALDEESKKGLAKQFDTEVYSRYSNQENGILAQQTMHSPNSYILNDASFKIELLNPDNNNAAEEGSWGRIVITDLFNYVMPLIRYDTGDLGIVEKTSEGRLQMKNVLGRKFDMIYDTKGQLIIPHSFYQIFDYSECKQFQFVQDDATLYKFIINGKPDATDEEGARKHYRKLLGQDAEINFEYVDEIPQLSSGKRQKVASNYKPKTTN